MEKSSEIVKILLFALAKEKAGLASIPLAISLPKSVRELKAAVGCQYPELATLVASSRLAVNRNFATENLIVQVGDEVALIPPVSGG